MENQSLFNQIFIVFKKYQNQPLANFLIAKIEIFLPKIKENRIVFRQISSVNTAQIIDSISSNQAIKITLIHTDSNSTTPSKNDNKAVSPQAKIKFSDIELANFLEKSGDKNPIHFLPNPIVPGLLILEKILDLQVPHPKYFTIKYINPLFLQNDFIIHQIAENELIGFSENDPIFQFKSINN